MKKILNILMAALVLTGISCSEDLEYKPGGVTPVQTLLLPADNYYVELQSASTATLRFSWEPALAADGQLPHYEVVFFGKPGGEIVYLTIFRRRRISSARVQRIDPRTDQSGT